MDQTDRPAGDPDPNASELEGGGTEQTWGQGAGAHEATLTPEEDSGSTRDEQEDTER